MANLSQPTLYERLGGVYSIASVIDRVMDDPRLNANPLVAVGSWSLWNFWPLGAAVVRLQSGPPRRHGNVGNGAAASMRGGR